jgi:hypothetical protein
VGRDRRKKEADSGREREDRRRWEKRRPTAVTRTVGAVGVGTLPALVPC